MVIQRDVNKDKRDPNFRSAENKPHDEQKAPLMPRDSFINISTPHNIRIQTTEEKPSDQSGKENADLDGR